MLSSLATVSYQLINSDSNERTSTDNISLGQVETIANKSAASERLTLQEVLESLAAKFLDSPDSRKITEDNIYISNDINVITNLITRLEQVEKTVAVLPERVAALESELGELSA